MCVFLIFTAYLLLVAPLCRLRVACILHAERSPSGIGANTGTGSAYSVDEQVIRAWVSNFPPDANMQ